jgi:hypothetical protein
MENRSAVADFHHLPYLRKGTLSCTPFAYLGTKNRTGTRHIGGVQDYGFYGSTKGMRHVNIRENCVREAIHEFHEIQISHIPGKHNPSDIFTKEHKDVSTFIALRDTLLRRSPSLQILANGVLSRMDGGC